MIIPYHINNVKEILDKMPNYFGGFKGNSLMTEEILLTGLEYPDVPCSDLAITKDGVKYVNYESCKIPLSLVYLTEEKTNGLKEIVQSHRGRFAVAHAMTYDPSIPVIDVRQKILRRLEILYYLALASDDGVGPGPNIFWLGQIIHCVQDSYSRVHTLRLITKQRKAVRRHKLMYKRNILISQNETKYETFRLVKRISDVLEKKEYKNHNDIQKFLLQNIKQKDLRIIIVKYPDDVIKIFKQLLFYKSQKKRVHSLFKGERQLPSSKNIEQHTSDYVKYPYILSFRYIPHQRKCGKLFHFNYDQPGPTQKAGFERYMTANIIWILKMYKQHVLDRSKKLQTKIAEMMNYLAKNVFPILHGFEKNISAIEGCDLSLKNVYKNYDNAISPDIQINMKKLDIIYDKLKLQNLCNSDKFKTIQMLYTKCHHLYDKLQTKLFITDTDEAKINRYIKLYLISVKRLYGIFFKRFLSQLYNNQ